MRDHITQSATLKTIEIIVSPKGDSRLETKGFAGDSCREASKFIEVALGKVAAEQLKPEFYERSQNEESIRDLN